LLNSCRKGKKKRYSHFMHLSGPGEEKKEREKASGKEISWRVIELVAARAQRKEG